jgi:hypothetical protein
MSSHCVFFGIFFVVGFAVVAAAVDVLAFFDSFFFCGALAAGRELSDKSNESSEPIGCSSARGDKRVTP